MAEAEDERAPRPLKLNKETLRDLAPGGEEAAAVRGGTLTAALVCRTTIGQTGPGPIEPPRTTTGITLGDCQPGKWQVEYRILTQYEVFEDGGVVVRNINTKEGSPEPVDGFRDLER